MAALKCALNYTKRVLNYRSILVKRNNNKHTAVSIADASIFC